MTGIEERLATMKHDRREELANADRAERYAAVERCARIRREWREYATDALKAADLEWLLEWARWNAVDPETFDDCYRTARYRDWQHIPALAVDLPGCFSIYVQIQESRVVGFAAVDAAAKTHQCFSLAGALIAAERPGVTPPNPDDAAREIARWADDGGREPVTPSAVAAVEPDVVPTVVPSVGSDGLADLRRAVVEEEDARGRVHALFRKAFPEGSRACYRTIDAPGSNEFVTGRIGSLCGSATFVTLFGDDHAVYHVPMKLLLGMG